MSAQTEITKDLTNKKLSVTRKFAAPLDKVWRAWTESDLLEKWWAPRPWRAETKTFDFSDGGFWLYSMIGPNGDAAWCRVGFKAINAPQTFSTIVGFSDAEGNIDSNFPMMYWLVVFHATADGTDVAIEITFDSEADLEKIVAMGFKEGFTMALGNLDELLEA